MPRRTKTKTLPLAAPSPDPESPASKASSATAQKAQAVAEAASEDPADGPASPSAGKPSSPGTRARAKAWERQADENERHVSQINHRASPGLHGPEQGEPADGEADEFDASAPAHSVVFLLHSGQPLSYITSLIRAEGPSPEASPHLRDQVDSSDPSSQLAPTPDNVKGAGAAARAEEKHRRDPTGEPPISFHTRTGDKKRWSPSTGIGDFLRDAARIGSFAIKIGQREIEVNVPSFEDRTRFLRASLYSKTSEIERLAKIKDGCDHLAHKGTQRVAFAGALMLGTWWGTVAFLTFRTDLGWDIMEPVTYLTGLGTVISGYIWFLWHNREVSYRAVLTETTSRRQQKLYLERGFNIERYHDLIDEVKDLRKTIKRVAWDYDIQWNQGESASSKNAKRALAIVRKEEDREKGKGKARKQGEDRDEEDDREDNDGDGEPDGRARQDEEDLRTLRRNHDK